MADRLPPHVIRDLGTKLAADIHNVTERTVLLADDPKDQFAIGRYGLIYLVGAVSAMASNACGVPPQVAANLDSLDVAIAMLVRLKESVAAKGDS
jgi:hypothetical protein